jgi:hypothetical protein
MNNGYNYNGSFVSGSFDGISIYTLTRCNYNG